MTPLISTQSPSWKIWSSFSVLAPGFSPEERILSAYGCGQADRATVAAMDESPGIKVYQSPGLKVAGGKAAYVVLVDNEAVVHPRFTLSSSTLIGLVKVGPGRDTAGTAVFRGLTSREELKAYAIGYSPDAGLAGFVQV